MNDLGLGYLERRIGDLELRLTNQAGMIEGTKVRIDRMVGTVADLLARFEAWKTIGNEMGELVNQLKERSATHEEMWQAQQRLNGTMSAFMDETTTMLKDAMAAIQGEER